MIVLSTVSTSKDFIALNGADNIVSRNLDKYEIANSTFQART